MMPPVESQNQFPTKCPFPSCRATLHREWVLGIIPKFIGVINVVGPEIGRRVLVNRAYAETIQEMIGGAAKTLGADSGAVDSAKKPSAAFIKEIK
jgi:hypothetical protein